MSGYLKLCNILHWLGLVLWVSALISAAVAAMNVFGTLDEMTLTLEQYAAYRSEHHWRLAAGHIMEGVFFTVDLLQFIAVPIVIVTLLLQMLLFRIPFKRPSNLIRTIALVIAGLLFAYHATMIAPKMNRELRAHWSAAERGEVEQAAAHRATFNEYHPVADAILRLNLLLVLVGAAGSAVALTSPLQRPSSSELEQPALLNRP
jgi:hypothetical protein